MFARNLLQAGDYFTCVPVGVPMTLQYNEKGSLEKLLVGHDSNSWYDVSKDLLQIFLKNKKVPNTISVKGGTTWIRGAVVSQDTFCDSGKLPDCILHSSLEQLKSAPDRFSFYSGHVESLATTFRGAVSIRQWLTLAGFENLPGYIAPVGIDEKKFDEIVRPKYQFRYPFISSYILYRKDGSVEFPSTGVTQCVVKRVSKIVDRSGYLFGSLSIKDGPTAVVPYSSVVKYNLNANTLILRDSDGDIIASMTTDGTYREPRSNKIECPTCGRWITVPLEGRVRCEDDHCNSVLYPRVNYMLSKLGLPEVHYEDYQSLTKKIGSVFMPIDIFELDQYADAHVSVDLSTAIRSIVPRSILFNDTQVRMLADGCNGSKETFLYYASHADKMKTDLDLNYAVFGKFLTWITDPENLSDIQSVLNCKNISIDAPYKKFNGAPIFRNKTIMITGSFAHGGLEEISSILSSYSATVVRSYDKNVDCVLVGDLNENTNGYAVRSAQKDRVPIMQESEFFQEYDIDSDIVENL